MTLQNVVDEVERRRHAWAILLVGVIVRIIGLVISGAAPQKIIEVVPRLFVLGQYLIYFGICRLTLVAVGRTKQSVQLLKPVTQFASGPVAHTDTPSQLGDIKDLARSWALLGLS
jgi:hypothetical protein